MKLGGVEITARGLVLWLVLYIVGNAAWPTVATGLGFLVAAPAAAVLDLGNPWSGLFFAGVVMLVGAVVLFVLRPLFEARIGRRRSQELAQEEPLVIADRTDFQALADRGHPLRAQLLRLRRNPTLGIARTMFPFSDLAARVEEWLRDVAIYVPGAAHKLPLNFTELATALAAMDEAFRLLRNAQRNAAGDV